MSNAQSRRPTRHIATLALAALLAACGGGGGGGAGNTLAGSSTTPDARNGTYLMMSADTHEYQLSLDFDAKTYRVQGNGIDQAGAFVANGAEFQFQAPAGGTATSSMRFTVTGDAVVGGYGQAQEAPFIATKSVAASLPATTLTFTMLGRTVDTISGAATTTIQQGRITSDGRVITCDDNTIFEIASCPVASTTVGTLTISGGVITAATPNGNVPYRLVSIGGEQVLLRASASLNNTRRFVVGLPVATTFTAGTFLGATTEPAWGTATVSSTAYSSTGTSPGGVTTTRTGTATAVGTSTLASLVGITTTNAGSFFSASSAKLGVVVAARNNVAAPGFMAIGVRQ